jgi:hypothetical protein
MTVDKSTMLGSAHASEIAEYLELIGDPEAAKRFHNLGGAGQRLHVPFIKDQWGYTGAKVGFIPEGNTKGRSDIQNAIGLEADAGLSNKSLKITLDTFYVENYPGIGQHKILCEFCGNNQTDETAEAMRFALTVSANDGSSAAHHGLPIFVGVNVGSNGISFKGRTVNVSSKSNDLILDALESSAFKDGLSLLTTAQPVLKPFVNLTQGVVASIAKMHKNKEVFNFAIGLDFSKSQTSAKLRLGSYIIIQTDEHEWDWNKFTWDPAASRVFSKNPDASPVKLNYMVFGVSKFLGKQDEICPPLD